MESGIWNLGILESWNLGILSNNRKICYYQDIIIIYATYCSACDNLILGEADLGNILSVYRYTMRCRI